MSKKYQKSLFVFRRDYRLDDNTALIKACEESESVVPVFCFDPTQYNKKQNDYFGENSFRFLIESLKDLDDQLSRFDSKLHFLQGLPWEKIPKLAVAESCDAVFFNDDYTPYALERDVNIKAVLERKDIELVTCPDVLLTVPGSICTNDGDTYKVFTPFKNKAREQTVAKPQPFSGNNLVTVRNDLFHFKTILDEMMPAGESSRQVGGRTNGLEKLDEIKGINDYATNRDFPAKQETAEISAHLKFGTLSVREVYHRIAAVLGNNSQLISELYWRDFYMHVLYEWPYVLGDEFQEKYQGMDWPGVNQADVDGRNIEPTDKNYVSQADLLQAWKKGKTGYPIVDAGMRQLLKDGWMHNRLRMIVASFLTKDLHLDWRDGEQHFANYLVGYDPASNNGGWQWAASTGTDAQPYFRIFNPWTQGKKFDPDAEYIKKYVPELQSIDPKKLHKLGELDPSELDELLSGIDYPCPIVNHKTERQIALDHYGSR